MAPVKKKQAVEDAQRVNAFRCPPERLKAITDSKHPLYDPRVQLPVSEKLARAMMAQGFKGTIEVWKDGEDLYVVSGIQRWRAACWANAQLKIQGKELIEIVFMLVKGDDTDIFGIATMMNQHRQDDSPMELARKAKRLFDFCQDEERVMATMGWERHNLRDHMKLFDTAPRVQNAVEAGKISVTAAARLSALTRSEQSEKLDAILANGGKATVKRIKKAIDPNKIDWRPRVEVRKFSERLVDHDGEQLEVTVVARCLDWFMGKISTEKFVSEVPEIEEFFEK